LPGGTPPGPGSAPALVLLPSELLLAAVLVAADAVQRLLGYTGKKWGVLPMMLAAARCTGSSSACQQCAWAVCAIAASSSCTIGKISW